MAIIEIKKLDFAYNGEAVLKDVSLTVRKRDFMAIIGPNGGGKSTLLKLILGLLTPVKGTIRVDGKSPQEASPCMATCRRTFTRTGTFQSRPSTLY